MKKQTKTQRDNRRISMALICRFTQSIHRDGFAYAPGNVEREIECVLGMVILTFNLSIIDDGEMMRAHSYLANLRDLFREEAKEYTRNESKRRFNHH